VMATGSCDRTMRVRQARATTRLRPPESKMDVRRSVLKVAV
jgi:hypothetical protein